MPDYDENERRRLDALRGYGVLDTPGEPEFDAIAQKAAQVCGTPIALISFVDENRQWFKARVGLDAAETPRSISFCTHAIRNNTTMVVEDASRDPRLAASPLVTGEPHIRFYAGAPLKTRGGARLGTLCVIDDKPRSASPDEVRQLERLAAMVVGMLERRSARSHRDMT